MESQGRVALILSRRLRMIKPEDGFILEPWTAT
jgi:hypothetical protein